MAKNGLIGTEYRRKTDNIGRVSYILSQSSPLLLDFSKKEHSLIIAKSGSGKSYLAGVIAEEAIRAMQNNYSMLMVDPMGVFHTLRKNGEMDPIYAWNQQMTLNTVEAKGMKNVEIWIPEGDKDEFDSDMYDRTFSLKANELTPDILSHTFNIKGVEPQVSLFRKARSHLIKQNPDFDLGDLIEMIWNSYDEWHFKSQTVEALFCKIDILKELGIITRDGIKLSDMVQEGKVAILDVSMSDSYAAKTIVNFLAERLLKIRKKMKRKIDLAKEKSRLINKPNNYIPHVLFLLDEAHKFLPHNKILKTYIKEGRNCGCMLSAISQSPDLDRHTYANIIHLFIGQLTYKDDLDGVMKMLPIERKPSQFRKDIKSLDVGNFYYYNLDQKLEKRIRVRPRKTMHSAQTEIEDENRYFIKEYKYQKTLIKLIENRGSLAMKDVPREYIHECAKMIKSGKIRTKEEEGMTFVELC